MEKCNARIVHGYGSGKPLLILVAANGLAVMVDLAVPMRERAMQTNGHSGKTVRVLTEAEAVEREIDERLEAEVAARRAALRQEIVSRMQREKDKAHYDAIAARGREVEREQEAFDLDPARLTELEASRKIDRERREAADERWRKVEAARANAELKR
jgi:hypothetical protein